ncbi:hypothetical protein PAECIP111893_05103 [Paenibacillus plantiphilus]|uniref:PsbP C-terminal domain-containing protein n=1 Tax=Paenibacillus plantiphilus TaxID=2905650 RepID=A0ABN8H198_9BACL|nr:hypothetical protein [Paenibacillus plantiphilus]CAH1224228.1 hypothetical protein PAECIP111893_05103 [Paenibacillus plantiphilus]
MKKFAKWSIVMMIMLVIATACSSNESSKEKEVDLGKVESGTYTNEYFGISLKLPEAWIVQDAETINELNEAGKEVIAGDDEEKKKDLDIAEQKTLNLLTISKEPLGSDEANPNLFILAEKVSLLQGIKTSGDYLAALQKMLTDSQLPYTFGESSTVKIGGKEFEVIEATLDAGEIVVSQKYYSALVDGYALSLAATYFDEASKAEMDKIIADIKIK